MTLHLEPKLAKSLTEAAGARHQSVDDYVREVLERELMTPSSGMVHEDGLLVYRTGNPLPEHLLDEALDRMRGQRAEQLLGH